MAQICYSLSNGQFCKIHVRDFSPPFSQLIGPEQSHEANCAQQQQYLSCIMRITRVEIHILKQGQPFQIGLLYPHYICKIKSRQKKSKRNTNMERTPQLFTCLILAKIKFFVIRDTIFLLKYQMTALMLEATFIKKLFPQASRKRK